MKDNVKVGDCYLGVVTKVETNEVDGDTSLSGDIAGMTISPFKMKLLVGLTMVGAAVTVTAVTNLVIFATKKITTKIKEHKNSKQKIESI